MLLRDFDRMKNRPGRGSVPNYREKPAADFHDNVQVPY